MYVSYKSTTRVSLRHFNRIAIKYKLILNSQVQFKILGISKTKKKYVELVLFFYPRYKRIQNGRDEKHSG